MIDSSKPGSAAGMPNTTETGVTRRDFLNEITFAALGIAAGGSTIVTYGYLEPNVLFEPPTKFRAGAPDLYPVDTVTYLPEQQVYIVRTREGFYAVSAVCTHLGCITQWKPEAEQIACPCHGSKFHADGRKIEGPAPRPLPHFSIVLSPDGELQVDKLETINSNQVLRT